MTDPRTLFLNTSQVRPSWTSNGLTLLNLGSTGANVSCAGHNVYEAQTFAGANEATAGTLFAPVVDQGHGHPCSTPVRVAISNGTANWTQAASISESGIAGGLGTATITTSDCASLASVSSGTAAALTSATVTLSSASDAGKTTRSSFRPIAMKKDIVGTPCQVAEITTSTLYQKAHEHSPSSNAVTTSFKQHNAVGANVGGDLANAASVVAVVASSASAPATTSTVVTSNGVQSGPGMTTASSFANTLASASITLSNAGIPVGIAIARQRYVSNAETIVKTTPYKENNASGSATQAHAPAAVAASSSYSSVIPCHSTILSSGFATAPLGVIAEPMNCPSKHGAAEIAPAMTNLQPFWSTHSAGISGTALPMPLAQPQPSQTQMPTAAGTPLPISISTQTQPAQSLSAVAPTMSVPQQHAAMSQWHSYTGAVESQLATGVPSTCGGFQIARDSVSGQIILIPTGQIDSSARQRNVFLVPSPATGAAASCSATNQHPNGTQQSFFISQQQSPSYSIVLDHLVTATATLPAPAAINIKQKPVQSAVVKLDSGLLTAGVMMPCGLAKSAPLQHNNASAAIGQQLISANNSSFSLVQQLTSSNVHNSNVNIPHHFSTISSSGSLVIQQISGNAVPSPLINHVNNSLLISAEAAATQSILNAQTPQYVPNNASFLFNAQQLTSSTSSSTLSSVPAATPDNAPTYGDVSTPSSTSYIISTSCANRNDISMTNGGALGDSATAAFKVDVTGSTEVATSVASNVSGVDDAKDVQVYVKSSNGDQASEQWSVQDAGNQTETNDEDAEPYDTDKKSVESVDSEPASDRKADSECETDCEEEKPAARAELPDFSGLQVLLNGIEQVEHVRETGTAEPSEAAAVPEANDEDKPQTQPNGLEILCALADQRFYEENEDDKGNPKSSPGAKNRLPQKIRNPLHESKVASYRYKSDSNVFKKTTSGLFDIKQERSFSPYEGNQLKMRLELARLQKKYRETRKVLDRLTHGKYAAASSSSTRSPTPLTDVPSTINSEPDSEGKTVATPIKRRPGRPRKYSDPSLAADKCVNTSVAAQRPSSVTPKATLRPKPKLKFDLERDSTSEKVRNGDLSPSPPVLEPMCSSSPSKTPSKVFKSTVLSPPTLSPSKKSRAFAKEPLTFQLRAKRSFSIRNGMDGFSSSEPDEDDDEIDSDDEQYRTSHEQSRRHYGNEMKKKGFYKSAYSENGKESTKPNVPEKRKVGRPRKYPKIETGSVTETGSKNQSSNNKEGPKYLTAASKYEKFSKYISSAMLESQRKPIQSSQYYDKECKPRITPKLKAEAKLKTWRQESPSPEENSLTNDVIDCPFTFKTNTLKGSGNASKSSRSSILASDDEDADYDLPRNPAYRSNNRLPSEFGSTSVKSSCSAGRTMNASDSKYGSVTSSVVTSTVTGSGLSCSALDSAANDDFRITAALLDDVEKHPVRVLIAVGGLFRAGELSAVRAPDLYGIKLDGERGHRTHIYSKEEVLRDVVREVEGKYPLKNGTRVCAFWSSQYLSLYPGYVTSFSSSDESEDEYFTSVEFDDGDSGRINIKDIRLLPKNFSINRRSSSSLEDLNSRTQYRSHDHHKRKRRISGVSFDEIPVDKQLHSPKSPSSSPKTGADEDETESTRRPLSPASSSHKTFADYDTGSRSSSFDNHEPRSTFEAATTSGDEQRPRTEDGRNMLSLKKHLKKKRKDKLRKSMDSFKRKNRKCEDRDADSRKLHKRHKHKHKHRKHHKRKRSSSAERKYVAKQETNEERGFARDVADCSKDDHKQAACSTINNNSKNAPCACKLKHDVEATTLPDETLVPVEAAVIKKENHEQIEPSVLAEQSPALVDQKQAEDENSQLNLDSSNEQRNPTTNEADETVAEPVRKKVDRLDVEKVSSDVSQSTSEKSTDSTTLPNDKQTKAIVDEDDSSDESLDNQDDNNSNDKFWEWCGKGFKRNGKGRAKKEFFQAIKRADVEIRVGDCAVFLTADNSAKPFIGRIKSMWESYGNMMVLVKWFYHPEETSGLKDELPYLGALFESPHDDKNDVQTISHKCEVVTIEEYKERLKKEPERLHNVYQSNDLYYLAGHYDPTNKRLTLEKGVVS